MCGINEDSFQKHLLLETKLTYDSSVKKALAMKVAMENPQASKKQVEEEIESGEQVHAIQRQRMPNVLVVVNRATSPEFVVVRKEDQCR